MGTTTLLLVVALLLGGAAQVKAQATVTVNTLADSNDGLGSCSAGTCSLRDAITQANSDNSGGSNSTADTINFASNVIGTITLTSALPQITEPVTISGPGAFLLTVSGNNLYQVFNIGTSSGAEVIISGLTIAYGEAAHGAGIFNSQAQLTIDYCTVAYNSASGNGGGIYSTNGSLDIYGSTVANNSVTLSSGDGGGIYSLDDTADAFVNSTLTGNSAPNGGAIDWSTPSGNTLTLTNDSISGNTASALGGGVLIAGTATPTINNSIVAGNTTAGTGDSGDCVNCGTQPSDNLIGGTPPTLGPLAWNGGPTQTMIPLPGSTAICAGSTVAAVNATVINTPGLTVDQRGFAFHADANANTCNYSNVDAGAVQTNYLIVSNLNGGPSGSPDCNATGSGNACSLWDAVSEATSDTAGDIVFNSSLFPNAETITLTQQLNAIPSENGAGLNLEGPGQALLTISGGNNSSFAPIFNFEQSTVGNISGVTISGGKLNNASILGGGAIYNDGELSLVSSTVSGNAGATQSTFVNYSFGGGICNDSGGTMLISGSTISNNQLTSTYGDGGGIYNDNQLSILNSTISGNSTSASGENGGGIFIDTYGVVAMTNSTVAGNSAISGGGISNNGTLIVADSTISGNTAINDGSGNGNGGGGIDNNISPADGTPLGLDLTNSIVAGNTNDNGGVDCSLCNTGSSYSYDTIDSATMIGGNPELGPLQINGSDTDLATMLPLPGSPVIAAGDTSELPSGLTTDERGYPRTTGNPAKLDLGAAQTNYTGIQFYSQPTDTQVNTDISSSTAPYAPSVEVLESNGSTTDAVSGIPITLTYSDAPNITGIPGTPPDTAPTLVSSSTINLATFSALEPTAVATGVTLTAASGPLSANSNPFNVYSYATSTMPGGASATYSPGDQTVALSATVTSSAGTVNAGTVTFTILNGATPVGTPVTSGTVTGGSAAANYTLPGGTSAGSYTIQAVYNPGGSFLTSTGDAQLTVNQAPQSINSFTALSSPVVYGTAPMALSATATSGLTVSFRVVSGPATVSGTTLTITGAGTVVVGADQGGNIDYLAATEVTQSITVDPAGYVVTVNSDDPTTANALNCPPGGPSGGAGLDCSLRDALAAASAYGGGNITFYAAAFNTSNTTAENTITLASPYTTLAIPANTTITGPTAGATQVNLVTVDGANQTAVFSLASQVTGVTISNLTVQHGYVASPASGGAAIQNQGALILTADTFYANQSQGSAGAIAGGPSSQLTVTDCTFNANSAALYGGAIAATGNLAVYDSTFYGNTSATATDTGGILVGSPGSLTIANSIVTGNTAAGSPDDIDSASAVTNNGGNLIGYLNGSAVNTAAIALSALGHYGGPTQTMVPLPGSPAICAGLVAQIPGRIGTDQRGYPRTNSAYTGSACVDTGAVQTNYSIAFVQQPSNVTVNTAMTPSPTVQLDESSVPFFDGADSFPIAVTLQGNGSLSISSANTAAATGLAAYNNLSVSAAGSNDTLTASLTLTPAGVTPAIAVTNLSSQFNVTLPPVTQLAFLTPPATPIVVGGNAGSSVQVEEENATGQIQASATDTITLQVAGPSGYAASYTATAIAGVATFNLSAVGLTTAGAYPYTASIAGNNSVVPAMASETVNKASSALGGPATASFTYGAGGTISVTVTGSGQGPGIAAPSGNVTYTIGSGAAQSAIISSGAATLTIPAALAAGNYTVAVSYAGDANYNAATTIDVSLTIGTAPLTITASNASRVYGAPNPTFTGTVSGQKNGDSFTETFSTTATASSPVAQYSIVPSVTGSNLADYSLTVTDGALTVTQASTTTGLTASSSSINPGQSITLTAHVAPQYTGTPTGTVTFYDGSTPLGNGPLSSGVATYSTTALAPGVTHSLTATYNGDTNFTISSSATIGVAVAPLDFTVSVSGATVDTIIPGSAATYTLIVSPIYSAYPGPVTFSISGLPAGYTATFTPSTIPANGGTQTVILTIQSLPGYAGNSAPPGSRRGSPFSPLPIALGLLLLPFAGARRLRHQSRKLGRLLCLLLALIGSIAAATTLTACVNHNGFFLTAASSHSLTVTGASGGLQHSVTITLNVE